VRAADLLAKWRQSPDPSSMVALCDQLADAAEQSPGSLTAAIAIEIGTEAEKHYPNSFEVLLATGRLYLASGQLHRALKPLIEAARFASEPRALRFLGEVFLRLGDARHAAMSFERAIKRGATDPETKAWHESARGYVPVQEQHGAKHVAGLVEKANAHVAADESDDDKDSLPRFRTPFPSNAELPDFSDVDDEKTNVLATSRVVAAIQQTPAGARGDFVGMLEVARQRFDTSDDDDGVRTILRQNGDDDLGLGMDEPTQDLRPKQSEPPSSALSSATSRLANAAAARSARTASRAKPEVATGPLPATPPPAGPVSATSDRIIPLDGSGGRRPSGAPGPIASVVKKGPADRNAAEDRPAAKGAKNPASLVGVTKKRRTGLGVGIIAVLTSVTLLGGGVVAVRMGLLPGLASHLPPWLSGQRVTVPSPEPDEAPVDDDVLADEPSAEPSASDDAAPEATGSASASPTASAAASAEEPPPDEPAPPKTRPPSAAKPPKPVANKPVANKPVANKPVANKPPPAESAKALDAKGLDAYLEGLKAGK